MYSADDKMETVSEYNLDGAGDRRDCYTEPDTPRYTKRKLANGLPIPVFRRTEETHLDSENDLLSRRMQRKCLLQFLEEFYLCPICHDPFIETTATSCGHKFCRQCIDEWRKENTHCLICSSKIQSQHRLYSDDKLVESQLDYLSPDIKHRFESAREKRLQQIHEDREKRQGVVKTACQQFHTFISDATSKKGVEKLGNKIGSASHGACSKLWEWNEDWNFGLIIGIVLASVLTLTYLTDITQFAHYMWLAMRQYDGNIPPDWLQIRKSQMVDIKPEGNQSLFEKFVRNVSAPLWYLVRKVSSH